MNYKNHDKIHVHAKRTEEFLDFVNHSSQNVSFNSIICAYTYQRKVINFYPSPKNKIRVVRYRLYREKSACSKLAPPRVTKIVIFFIRHIYLT